MVDLEQLSARKIYQFFFAVLAIHSVPIRFQGSAQEKGNLPTTQDRSGTRVVAPVRFAFRIRNQVGVLDEKYFNGWPARSPVNASPHTSRYAAHDSGSAWFATPSP
jgi:hypothetical protein